MKEFNVAVLGATGAVGQEMIKILEERRFPVKKLTLYAGKKSSGMKLKFNGTDIIALGMSEANFTDTDIVLNAAPSEASKLYSPTAAEKGAIVIDNSSAFRMNESVPLVIPEINKEDAYLHRGVIANPNCTTIITLIAVNPIHRHSRIKRLVTSTYQAVSGAGKQAVNELNEQTLAYSEERDFSPVYLKHQILHNLIPQIDDFTDNGYTKEELKLVNESRKILHAPEIKIASTCVRVPVIRSHSVSVLLETEHEVTPEKARELLLGAPGVTLSDDVQKCIYPMPLYTSGQDSVFVGRIRSDISGKGLILWCCGDQLRKGAATNAVQIAELFK